MKSQLDPGFICKFLSLQTFTFVPKFVDLFWLLICVTCVEYFAKFWGPFDEIFAVLDDLGMSISRAMNITAQVSGREERMCIYSEVSMRHTKHTVCF